MGLEHGGVGWGGVHWGRVAQWACTSSERGLSPVSALFHRFGMFSSCFSVFQVFRFPPPIHRHVRSHLTMFRITITENRWVDGCHLKKIKNK